MEIEEKSPTAEVSQRVIWLHWRNIRDIAVVALVLVFAWKLLNADLKINIAEFAFTDLLSLILALFAVWLSAMFYFKADEASSRFYDNSYRFTKEMGIAIGRMEVGFGERLTHLNEGLRDALSKRLVSEAEVVEQKAAEVNKIVEDLVAPQGVDAPAPDTGALLAELRKAQEELAAAKKDLAQLERLAESERLAPYAISAQRGIVFRDGTEVLRILAMLICRGLEHKVNLNETPDKMLQDLFISHRTSLPVRGKEILEIEGLTKRFLLTTRGLAIFRIELDAVLRGATK